MISVIMPYWRRPQILAAGLDVYRRLYSGLDLEIIIVDDGSRDKPINPPVTAVRLPDKDHALNPCVPLNEGVAASHGDILVLTNPEVIHRAPILEQMRAQLSDRSYIAAACWSPSAKWWYCHSTLMPPDSKTGRAPVPKGAGLHFCSMLTRKLYDEVGGFSEEYRDGQGYEDNDFLWKLDRAGATFKICDDLVTDHMDAPRSEWPAGGIKRNRTIFEQKWPDVRSQ